MATLSQLPVEVISHVLSYLPSVADLMRVSDVCRLFQNYVSKYGEIEHRKKYRRVRLNTDKDLINAFRLLLCILRKPRLGKYVQIVELWFANPEDETETEVNLKLPNSQDDYYRLLSSTRAAGFLDKEQAKIVEVMTSSEVKRNECPYFASSLAALIISVSPCLESLAVLPSFVFRTYGSELVGPDSPISLLLCRANLEPRNNVPPSIKHIQRVHCLFVYGLTFAEVHFQFRVDSLQGAFPNSDYIELAKAAGRNLDQKGMADPLPTRDRALFILNSGKNTISQTIVICPSRYWPDLRFALGGQTYIGGIPSISPYTLLQTLLVYQTEWEVLDIVMEGDEGGFDSHGVGIGREAAWYPGSPQLQEKLDFDAEWSWKAFPAAGLWERRGSLRDFTKLRRLSIGIQLLWLFAIGLRDSGSVDLESFSLLDNLPPCLEFLSIRGYNPGESELVDRLIKEIHTHKHARLPSLREVQFSQVGYAPIAIA